jgi:hypothetical protein
LADSRDAALALCGPLRTTDASERTLAGAEERAAEERRRFGIDPTHAEWCDRLVGPLLSTDPAWRSTPEVLGRGKGGASAFAMRGSAGH